jgi:hypothetical protein
MCERKAGGNTGLSFYVHNAFAAKKSDFPGELLRRLSAHT